VAPRATQAPAPALDTLRNAIAAARRELTFTDRIPDGYTEPLVRIAKPAVAGGSIDIRAAVPRMNGAATDLRPVARLSEVLTLADSIMGASRVVRFGARIISDVPTQPMRAGEIELGRVPVGMIFFDAAPFHLFADGVPAAEIGTSGLSEIISEDGIVRPDDLAMNTFRVEIPRSAFHNIAEADLYAGVLHSIALGVARAADRELISAIMLTAPSAFSIAELAAHDLRFDDLRALIGTSGTGAQMDQGKLFAAGVPAEVSPDSTSTIIAAWHRFGIAVSPQIDLVVHRVSADGGVVLTCFVGLRAVTPNPELAWVV
jgi:hypothetical protein